MGRRPLPVRKIVILRPGCSVREDRLHLLGGNPVRRLRLINALVVDFPAGADFRLAAELPEVLRVDDDLPITLLPGPPAVAPARGGLGGLLPRLGRWLRRRWRERWRPGRCRRPAAAPPQAVPWGVVAVGAPDAWQTTRGQGVRVAVMDTGVDLRHPDLRPNLAGGFNALSPGRDPADDNGHGTHVAGVVAAADNAVGVVGVAPAARLYAVKVLDRWGVGFLSDLVHGLEWCVRERMQVVNLSLGTSLENETFREAVRQAAAAGIVLVAAAGNDGPGGDTVSYPARYPEVVAVAACDRTGRLASFSSRGPQVSLAAPGVDIPSAWPGSEYRTLSGTSMAAPHVAGAAALLLAAQPGADAAQVRRRLVGAARRVLGNPYPLLDAAAAVRGR